MTQELFVELAKIDEQIALVEASECPEGMDPGTFREKHSKMVALLKKKRTAVNGKLMTIESSSEPRASTRQHSKPLTATKARRRVEGHKGPQKPQKSLYAPVGKSPYSSKAWIAQRDRRKELDGQKCQVPGCARLDKLHVHHRQYRKGVPLGSEPIHDLITVCEYHHSEIHNLHNGNNLTLPEATSQILQE